MNISSLREELETLGISTVTPGLRGDERRRILQERLKEAQTGTNSTETPAKQGMCDKVELEKLSITELRKHLEKNGHDTSTPGLQGSDRRSALIKRISNICSSEPAKEPEAASKFDRQCPVREKEKTSSISVRRSRATSLSALPTATFNRAEVHEPMLPTISDELNNDAVESLRDLRRKNSKSNLVKEEMQSSWNSCTPNAEDSKLDQTDHSSAKFKRKVPLALDLNETSLDDGNSDYPDAVIAEEQETACSSPSKRRQLRRNRALKCRDDIQEIRRARLLAIEQKLAEEQLESLSELVTRLKQIQSERERIVNSLSSESKQDVKKASETHVTNVVTGALQEYDTKDILPMLQQMESELRRKIVIVQDHERHIRNNERKNKEHGVEREKILIDQLRELEEELGEQFMPQQIQQQNKPPLHSPSKRGMPRARRKSLPSLKSPMSSLKKSFDLIQATAGDKLGQKAHYYQSVKRDFDKAESCYQEALTLEPAHAVNLGNYALFLQMVRKSYDNAEEHFLRAIDADPSNVTNISNYANFLKRIRSDNERADSYYKKGLETNPKHVANLGNYANFLRHAKRNYPMAEQYYLQAIDLDPKHANNLSQYASLLSEMKKTDKADEYYKKSLEADPKNANIVGNFANFLKRQKKNEQAKDYYIQALKLDRNNEVVYRNYAIFLRDCPEMRTGVSHKISMHPRERRQLLRRQSEDALSVIEETCSTGADTARSTLSNDGICDS